MSLGDGPVIAGRGIVTALGSGIEAVWRGLLARSCGIRQMTRFPGGKYRTAVAGELPAELVTAVSREHVGLAFSLAVEAVTQALAEAFAAGDGPPAGRTGLVLATTKAEIAHLERAAAAPRLSGARHLNPYLMARDLASRFGAGGPVLAVSMACASGTIAVIQAARLLVRGAADFMIVAGVDVLSDFVLSGFSSLMALSPGPCRPFDRRRDGLSLGEGAGAVVLARKSEAVSGPTVRLSGWGISNDANHITGPSRDGSGLVLAVRRALERASVPPERIDYLNAHGTGTVYNDAMEAKAFHRVFGKHGPPVSSLKGYFGHTLGAAGVIETVLCARAVETGLAPATLGLEELGVEEPVRVLFEHEELPQMQSVLKVNSGFGGINAALVLEEAA